MRADGRAIRVAVISAAAAVALTVLVVTGPAVPSLDRHVLDAVNAHRPLILDGVTDAITNVFSPAVDAAVLLIGALVVGRRKGSRRPLVLALTALAALVVVVLAVKYGVARPAPPPHHSHDGGAFPSGHTASALVCYGTLAMLVERGALHRRFVALTVAVTTLVGATMVYGGFHWLSDVVAAVPFGVVALAGVRIAKVRIILSESPVTEGAGTHDRRRRAVDT